ncbi:hypothetical protein A33M_4231 [Rhodovulum sp. PH10]|uniref:DUF6894 family protein n=1 Tax=Rhodovulum sp. PH10 TaxID=1187851 RepID=UPI00027C29BB|nr:hypothetical protein [Rhodovulum sp. PH10]EJW13311.1 hypothetical protein A33M_4231 [Rhodovulum sp. PH10]
MARYTITISNGETAYEASDIVLPDPDLARDLAVKLAADLFSTRPGPFDASWNRCSVGVVSEEGEQVFEASAAEAALIERDIMRSSLESRADN